MKIYAPVKDANGVWASVQFVNGVGETDNPKLIEWFKSHGYKVPIEDTPIKVSVEPIEEEMLLDYADKEPDFESMTPNQLRDWAKANGFGGVIKNTRNREKLIELIRG